MADWYRKTVEETLKELNTDITTGLSYKQAEERLNSYGKNELVDGALKKPWKIIMEQASGIMVIMLVIAGIISFFLGETTDAIVILAIVVINILLGFSQEYKAEKAMAALRKMSLPTVKVKREGKLNEISSKDLVPGDIIQIDAGNSIPADCRIIQSVNLKVQESALTGESEPIEKMSDVISDVNLSLGDRKNTGYMGTVSTSGRGTAVVTQTGMNTELGHIAKMMQSVDRQPTPLQKKLDQLGKLLAVIALAIVAIVFVLGIFRGEDIQVLFMTAISMAVAAVPEGLPALVTISLALGTQRLLKRNALIRKLLAVETLGSVSVICSDKTGTLTQNKMTVTSIYTSTLGAADINGLKVSSPDIKMLLTAGLLCNDSEIQENGKMIGDPTEGALVEIAQRNGYDKRKLESLLPRINELAFDSDRKMMTTLHLVQNIKEVSEDLYGILKEFKYISFTKGAADSLLKFADRILDGRLIRPITQNDRDRLMAVNDSLARKGVRVLAAAFRPAEASEKVYEDSLILIGLFGMIDPPRPEVKAAVEKCRSAGIKPVMITGDHPMTALYIAKELSITQSDTVVTGSELEKMTVEELEKQVESTSVYARVSPEHKLKIVQAWQNKGYTAAMTGDGVNDAPALKKSNIGVAMGITGTDVSKQAADMVLLDDNFSTIVSSVEEGRAIYDNIIKFIKYILSSNFAEILLMLAAPFIGMPLPLLPLQILWINLVTDGLPGLALGVEPAEKDIMKRPPRNNKGGVISTGLLINIIIVGIIIGAASIVTGHIYYSNNSPVWQTMIFMIVTISQMFYAYSVRSSSVSVFKTGLWSNKYLLGAVLLTVALQLIVVYIPALSSIFGICALSFKDLLIAFGVSSIVLWYDETRKFFIRRSR